MQCGAKRDSVYGERKEFLISISPEFLGQELFELELLPGEGMHLAKRGSKSDMP
jgi:hypothetical protein